MKKLLSLPLLLVLLVCLCPAYAAEWGAFSDVSGHWAEQTLQKGFEDGLLQGFEDGTLRPDEPITTAQMITIITRLLSASEQADVTVPADAWYGEALKKAVRLGLISANAPMDAPMSRQDAVSIMAKAFSLIPAEPDVSVLDGFSDKSSITDGNRPAMAALVSKGLLIGFGGSLEADSNITRAEFLTIVYRVAENYITADKLGTVTGSSVVSGNAIVLSKKLGSVWFDCSCKNLTMHFTEADTVTLRGHRLDKVAIFGASEIGRLVVDSESYSLNDSSLSGVEIGTLQLAGTGSATLSAAKVHNLEITSSTAVADLSGDYETVIVSAGTNVSISGKAQTVRVIGNDAKITIKDSANIDNIIISGIGNTVTIDGAAQSVEITGSGTVLIGSGSAENASVKARDCTVTLKVTNLTDSGSQLEIDRVLKLVTLGYKGDYTLKWAQEHDYEDYEKEIWINAKGYSSKTDYLIWINLSMQRVNIFQGSKGSWQLVRSFIVGTGAPGRGTPVGEYYITYKQSSGWTTSTYTVKPVVGFKSNSGYAFHSRLYYPGTEKLSDSSIGFPVSHGCVRMYDEDVRYIYNNIPLNTAVIVY
jgi:lipoprotein-anchoring transpeptidase ErfK/SrfK